MKTLLIEWLTLNNSEVIALHDLFNKTISYKDMTDYNYEQWVKTEAEFYRKQCYKIFNDTDINITEVEL